MVSYFWTYSCCFCFVSFKFRFEITLIDELFLLHLEIKAYSLQRLRIVVAHFIIATEINIKTVFLPHEILFQSHKHGTYGFQIQFIASNNQEHGKLLC